MKLFKVALPSAEAARLRKATAITDSLLEDARAIMKGVAERGDPAVLDYTTKFDGVRLDSLRVTAEEVKQAYEQVTREQVKAVRLMKERLAKSEIAVLKPRPLPAPIFSSKARKLFATQSAAPVSVISTPNEIAAA